jgi:hypothetical protein
MIKHQGYSWPRLTADDSIATATFGWRRSIVRSKQSASHFRVISTARSRTPLQAAQNP